MPIVLKSGSLNIPEPSVPVQACNGIAFFYSMPFHIALYAKAISDQKPTANIGMSVLSDAYCVVHNFKFQMLNCLLNECHCSVDDIHDKTRNLRVNVIWRRVRIIIVAMEKRQIIRILNVCLYPYLSSMQSACAVLYCYLWPVRLNHIFPRYLLNSAIFVGGEKKLL